MKHFKPLLITIILLIPFGVSAKKPISPNNTPNPPTSKNIESQPSDIGLAEDPESIEEIIERMLSADSTDVIETKVTIPNATITSYAAVNTVNDEDDDEVEENVGGIPASDIYPAWTNSSVNPYGIRLENSEDTTSIDLSTFCFPLPKHYRVTSEFGFRRARHHYGIDLKLNIGDSVVSVFDGMVRIAKTQKGGYGKYVVVRHNNGLETVYGHLNKILVTEGQVVSAGEMLGEGGNTGRSTGPHLHFEVRYLGQAINPRDVVDFGDDKLCCHNDTLNLTKLNFAYVKEIEAIKHWSVRSGDSLSRIASKTGVSISRLCALNNIKKTSVLRIGQRVRYN